MIIKEISDRFGTGTGGGSRTFLMKKEVTKIIKIKRWWGDYEYRGVNGPGFNATNISLPWYCWGHTFLFLFIYLFIYFIFFFFLLFWLLLLTGGVNITKVFSEIYYLPIPNKMVALSTGREVTNQVENNKGVSLIFFFFGGVGINAVP